MKKIKIGDLVVNLADEITVMQQLEYIKKAVGGKIVIEVPEEFEGKELLICISAPGKLEESEENWHLLPGKKKLEILQQYKGTAKFPDMEINKYDVYDQ